MRVFRGLRPSWLAAIVALTACTGLLGGCLPWEEDAEPKIFRAYVSGYLRPVPLRAADGQILQTFGQGVESAGSPALALDSYVLPEPSTCTTGAGRICPGAFVIARTEPYFLFVTRDNATLWKNVNPAYLATLTEKEQRKFYTVYDGMPCRFSDPRAHHLSGSDTVRLVAKSPVLSFAPDSIRFAIAIDSAASKAADPRASVSGRTWVVASARVTCP